MFAAAGLVLPPDDPLPLLAHADWLWAAGRPPVGFAVLGVLDGSAHLEQLAVHPAHGRRGIGGALLAAACADARDRGYRRMTLTTFRDLAWNAPWYARRGFTPVPEHDWGPELREQWRREVELGIVVAPRVVMARDLDPPARAAHDARPSPRGD
ncbi:GNAT family N-acetyltransferase [Marinactinospora rubrisoli]|uniref:GNAT family N-acetyltransferase n=1 Tax=Marinactinospora rubrisoli TaxID=2715399 RepID=A0ABW2KJR9_9ACTN